MPDLETLIKPDSTDSAPPRSKPLTHRRWPWLLAPLMAISVLLHVALLFVPLPTLDNAAEEIVDEETSEADADIPVDILNLSEIAAPEPPPEPTPEPPQQPQPRPQPPPSNAVPPSPEPEVIEERPPEEEFIEAAPPVEAGFSEEPPPPFDAGAATEQFVGDISGLGVENYTSEFGLPEPTFLRNPGNAACFINPSGGPQLGVRVANWLDKEPQTLLQENLQNVYGPRGITFEELEPFCGERYFRAYTAEGQPFMTLSLVTLEGSTLLVVWETPPQ